jgi:protein-tyrosine phosphatase
MPKGFEHSIADFPGMPRGVEYPISTILQAWKNGACALLPTESTYELTASALDPGAVARLQSLISQDELPAIILKDEAQVRDWMPLLSGAGLRLYRKLGPGPLVVRANGGYAYGLCTRLPESVQRFLIRDGCLALRWPAHPVWAALGESDQPLISVALPCRTAQEALARIREEVACVDAGPTEFGALPGVVRVEGRRCLVEREGVLRREQIEELVLCRILFICTGNTCRSPMAEALCGKLLADRLGCKTSELQQHGFCVQSAGLAAMMGCEASPEAVTVIAQEGGDLSSHASRMITTEMLAWADHIFTMTASHWYALKNVPRLLDGISQPRLLSPQDEDVADPIGGEFADYRACANQILACLEQRLPELLES